MLTLTTTQTTIGGAMSQQDSELDETFYAVRAGHRPGVYTSVTKLIDATKGCPYTEFDVFNDLAQADDYLCPWFELARTSPHDPSIKQRFDQAYYIGIASARTSSDTYSGFGVFVDPVYDRNICQVILEPTSVAACELEAVHYALMRAADKLSSGSVTPKPTVTLHITTRNPFILTQLMKSAVADKWETELPDEFRETYINTKPEYERASALITVIRRLEQQCELVFQSITPRSSFYAARMAMFLSRKAVNIRVQMLQNQQQRRLPTVYEVDEEKKVE